MDCNKKPSQRDYPECFDYSLMTASSSTGCPPSHVEITVSGGPGSFESHRTRVEVGKKELRFFDDKDLLATALIESGRITGFRAGRKLPAFNRGALLRP